MEAFRQAVERWGADILEMDVRRTRDGHLVVIHDATIDRTTDGSGGVAEMTLSELQSYDAGARFLDPSGLPTFRGRGVRIPTFAEVLERFPETRLNVEAKDPSAAPELIAAVRRAGAQDRVLLAAELEEARADRLGYEGPTSASRRHLTTFHLTHRLPFGGPYTPPVDALQPPFRWEGREISTPRFIAMAHRKGLAVHVWTVDDPADMRLLLDRGADGVQTDRPDLLAELLHREYGRSAPPGLLDRGSGG